MGFKSKLRLIKQDSYFKRIDFRCNKLRECGIAISELLEQNPKIEQLQIGGNCNPSIIRFEPN